MQHAGQVETTRSVSVTLFLRPLARNVCRYSHRGTSRLKAAPTTAHGSQGTGSDELVPLLLQPRTPRGAQVQDADTAGPGPGSRSSASADAARPRRSTSPRWQRVPTPAARPDGHHTPQRMLADELRTATPRPSDGAGGGANAPLQRRSPLGAKGNSSKWTNRKLWNSIVREGPTLHLLQRYPPHILNFAVKDLAAGGELSRAVQVFELMAEQGLASEHTLAQLFKGCCMCDTGLAAADAMAALALRCAREEGSCGSRRVVVDGSSSSGGGSSGGAGISARSGGRGLITELSITACVLLLLEAQGVPAALQCVQALQRMRVRVGVEPYNAIIHRCVRDGGGVAAVMGVFEELRNARGAPLDKYTYSLVLQALMSAKQYAAGAALYGEMTNDGVLPDQMLYCQFITCCAYAMRLDKAVAVFDDMRSRGLTANAYIYNALLNAFAQAGQVEEATALYRDMTGPGAVPPDAFTFVALFKAGARSGRQSVQEISALLADMRAQGVALNAHIATALITCYRAAEGDSAYQRRQLAMAAFQTAYREPSASGTPALYHAMMAMHGDAGDVTALLQVYEMMVARGVQPSESTFNLVLRHCRDAGLSDKAAEIAQLKDTMEFLDGGRGAQLLR